MANEAVTVELLNGGEVIRYTVADGTSISGGTICKLTDPRTGSASTGSGDVFIGIAAADKVANDGSTSLGFYTKGLFDLTVNAGTGVTLGDYVTSSGANLIRDATDAEVGAGKAIGKALETGATSEVILVAVGVY